MHAQWVPLGSIPAEGAEFILNDQAGWSQCISLEGLECRISRELCAKINVLLQEDGIFFQGTLSGAVVLPCHSCGEDALVTLNHDFDSFEPFPDDPFVHREPQSLELQEFDDAVIRRLPSGTGIEINPFALAWQEFLLALPIKPLCREVCRGLCTVCGTNYNTSSCQCTKNEGDPRLAKLRGLTLKKK